MSPLEDDSTPPPDFSSSWICIPVALPKTTKSSKELPPSLFAPWTETQAASPAANKPEIIESLPLVLLKAWPLTFVGVPPII